MKIVTIDGHTVPVNYQISSKKSEYICIFAHGITAEKSEGGIFDRMGSLLRKNDISTVQMDFRGHGDSLMRSDAMTITGEVFDLISVINEVSDYKKIFLVSASFGAVSTGLLPKYIKKRLTKICLWNPVLSLRRTFIVPELAWQKNNFGYEKINKSLDDDGTLLIDDSFVIGSGFLSEIQLYNVEKGYSEYKQPIKILHGDKDTYVSYEKSKELANTSENMTLETIQGSEHGFGRPKDEKLALSLTLEFFT